MLDWIKLLFPITPFLSSKTSRKRSHLIHIHRLVFDFFSLLLAPCFFLCLIDFLWVIFGFGNFTRETVPFVLVWWVKEKLLSEFLFYLLTNKRQFYLNRMQVKFKFLTISIWFLMIPLTLLKGGNTVMKVKVVWQIMIFWMRADWAVS